MSKLIVGLALLTLIVSCCLLTEAQVTNALGTPPFSSIGGGPFDQINLGNLNTHFEIPIINKPGRGLPFTFSLTYDSLVWAPVTSGSTTSWKMLANGGWHPTGTYTTAIFESSGPTSRTCNSLGTKYNYTEFRANDFIDPMGVKHYVGLLLSNDTDVPCNPDKAFRQLLVNDGSGMTASVSTDGAAVYGSVKLLNGTGIGVGTSSWQDNNGNYITGSTDTLGQTALTISGTAPGNVTYTYTGPSGAASYVLQYYNPLTIQTAFHSLCSGVQDVTITNVYLVKEIDLPDFNATTNPSARYTFTYEPTPGAPANTTGRIQSVTLPTGGQISYSYLNTSSQSVIECSDGTPSALTRTTSDGTTTYTRPPAAPWTTTVTDAISNVTTYYFSTNTTTNPNITNFYETKRSNALSTVFTCYNGVCPAGTTVTLPISSTAVYSQAGSSGRAKESATTYNTSGQVTRIDNYDFGGPSTTNPPAVGGALRSQIIAYSGAFPSEIDVTELGTLVSETLFKYDEYAVVGTTGTPSHVTGSNSGNLTTVQRWLGGSSFLTSHYHYFDTGNVSEFDDANGGSTHYTYGACGNSFVTLVTPAISTLQTSSTWNCTGGVQTSTTDPNGAVNSVGYADAHYWRPTSTTDPLTNVTSISYPSLNTITSAMNFNAGNSTSSGEVRVDGYGRPYLAQTRQGTGSSTWDTVETFYDKLGRASEQTLPYAGSEGQTVGTGSPNVTTTFDALSRPSSMTDSGAGSTSYSYSDNDALVSIAPPPAGEHTKQRQLEYDGLGRLTSVCEVTSAAAPGTCNQSSSQTGFWTKYAYGAAAAGETLTVTQNAQSTSTQTRTYLYDHLGRLISEGNPENGTTTYAYDSDSVCGSSAGDRVKRVDAVSNTTCFAYDVMHRSTTVSYSGPYAAKTPTKTFVYDTATLNGVAMANGKGRVVEAYTGPSTAKITDVGRSYSLRGEVTDLYSATQHSGGYYHLSWTYWPNGVVKTLVGMPGLPNFTYGIDGEGRVSTVSASSGQNPLTGTTYNAAGQVTHLSFGSADTDDFTYDPNTGRMTQYKFTMNGQSEIGTPTWNSNGTLASLSIVDPFNSLGGQTCSYSYDDLERITGTSCGSTWAQTFGFDPFGNISKSGSSSFQASYSSATNRITMIGTTFVPTYDANGSVTNDGFHTYAWDAEGHMVGLDTGTSTYDALGELIEGNAPGYVWQYYNDPSGNRLGLVFPPGAGGVNLKLPGGAVAVYAGGTLQNYWHPDWLGSSRLGSTPSRTLFADKAFAPYGEAYAATGSGYKTFAGYSQNQANDMYDTLFREYHSTQGRWLTPDPAGMASVDMTNPQSWNRYVYVLNNPLGNLDPLGLDVLNVDPCPDSNGDCGYGPPRPLPLDPPFPLGLCVLTSINGTELGPCNSRGGLQVDPSGVGRTKTKPANCPTPPPGPINYNAVAEANSKMSLLALVPQFLSGGAQDYKPKTEFGSLQNREAVGNFAFGASGAARGWTLFQTMMYAGMGATVSNASTKLQAMIAQSANMEGQYGGNPNTVPQVIPASTMGPGFPGFPVTASNGIPTQGDQVGWNENAAVAAGYMWRANGCH